MRSLYKIASIIFALFLVMITAELTTFTVFAEEETVNFEMQNAEYKPNRVFTVAVYAKADAELTAGIFDITYNSELIEFRKARAAESSSDVEINQSDGEIRLVYLNSSGKDISAGEAIFALTFKTADEEGSSQIEFSASECCDGNAEFLNVGECTASTITISSSASGTVSSASIISSDSSSGNSSSSSKTSSGSSGTKSSKTSSSSASQKNKETTSASEDAEASETENSSLRLNSLDDGKLNAFLSGIGITLGVGVIIIAVFIIGKKYGMSASQQNAANTNDKSIVPKEPSDTDGKSNNG